MRVAAETFVSNLTRRPIVWPTRSPSCPDMRAAAARAANRLGSRTIRRPSRAHCSSSNDRGTRVVFPAPGGATSTATLPCASAPLSPGRASSIGSIDALLRPIRRAAAPSEPPHDRTPSGPCRAWSSRCHRRSTAPARPPGIGGRSSGLRCPPSGSSTKGST